MEYINMIFDHEYFWHGVILSGLLVFGSFFISPKKPKRKQIKGVWYCKKCHHELTKIEREYKGGVCPYCKSRSDNRFIDSYRK